MVYDRPEMKLPTKHLYFSCIRGQQAGKRKIQRGWCKSWSPAKLPEESSGKFGGSHFHQKYGHPKAPSALAAEIAHPCAPALLWHSCSTWVGLGLLRSPWKWVQPLNGTYPSLPCCPFHTGGICKGLSKQQLLCGFLFFVSFMTSWKLISFAVVSDYLFPSRSAD